MKVIYFLNALLVVLISGISMLPLMSGLSTQTEILLIPVIGSFPE